MTYRPNLRFVAAWGGTDYDGDYSDLEGDTYNFDLKYGSDIALEGLTLRVLGARGQVELFDRAGRYSSEGTQPFNADQLRRRTPIRLMADDVVVWQGNAEPPRPFRAPRDVPRSLLRLRGKHHDDLAKQIEVSSTTPSTDAAIWNTGMTAAGITSSGNLFNSTPTGVVVFEGTARQFMSEMMQFGDGYGVEGYTGEWQFKAPRAFTTEGTFQLDPQVYDIDYPLLDNYPRVDGIRNAATVDVRQVVLGAEESLFTVTVQVDGGATTAREVALPDGTDILYVSNWRIANAAKDAVTGITPSITVERARRVTFSLLNNGPSSETFTAEIFGRPSRIESVGKMSAANTGSQASYGVRSATDDQPPWWSYEGQANLNQIITRLANPLRFVRARIPGWQPTKSLTDALYGVHAGDAVRVTVDAEEVGEADVALNMMVMSVRVSSAIGRMPRIEWDLIELPLRYDAAYWNLYNPDRSKLGRTTILSPR